MTRYLLVAAIFGLIVAANASAQKRSVPAQARNLDSSFVITVDDNGKSTVAVQFDEYTGSLFTEDVQDLFKRLNQPQSLKGAGPAAIMVRADPEVDISDLLKVINAARALKGGRIMIDSGDGTFFSIAPKLNPNAVLRPDPLFLLVRLEKTGDIFLNDQRSGSVKDRSPLEKTLTQLFSEREKDGVLREGTNEIEKTVTVKAPGSPFKYGNLMLLAAALQKSGADHVILKVDDDTTNGPY